MTMRELAALAGVSVGTVSKAFSGSGEIGDACRERIFRLAKEQGCFEKFDRTPFSAPVVAVLCPELKSRHYSAQLSLLSAQIRARGGVMLALDYDFDRRRAEELLDYILRYTGADALITYYSPQAAPTIPTVVMGEHPLLPSVRISRHSAIKEALSLLASLGHKRIGVLTEALTDGFALAVKDCMQELGVFESDALFYKSEARFEAAGYEGMAALLAANDPPSAVLAAYDNVAIGAIRAAEERGLSIPRDLSIIGSDDLTEDSYLPSALSSVSYDNEDLAELVTELLFSLLAGKEPPSKTVKLSARFIARQSIGEFHPKKESL